MIATAIPHLQRRRFHRPAPATTRIPPSNRKRIPAVFPKGRSRACAAAWIAHARSRMVPRHTNVAPARNAMVAPKNRKTPMAMIPLCGFVCTSMAHSNPKCSEPLTISGAIGGRLPHPLTAGKGTTRDCRKEHSASGKVHLLGGRTLIPQHILWHASCEGSYV